MEITQGYGELYSQQCELDERLISFIWHWQKFFLNLRNIADADSSYFITQGHKFREEAVGLSEKLKLHYQNINKFIKLCEKEKQSDEDEVESKEDSYLVNKLLSNHLIRQGRFVESELFSSQTSANIDSNLKEGLSELFLILKTFEKDELNMAIEWANRNREMLAKKDSSLEFELHKLKFLSLLDKDGRQAALSYAKSFFVLFAEKHLKEIQKLMTLILYEGRLASSPYASMLSTGVWAATQAHFISDFCMLIGLSGESALTTSMLSGSFSLPKLQKLNTLIREKISGWKKQSELTIEVGIPLKLSFHSIFACPVNKQVSTEDNPPMMLPCGHVISKEAVSKLSKGNSNRFKCPYCPAECISSQILRVYF